VKRIFSFSQKKFLSLSLEQQHKKCAELLQSFAKTNNEADNLEYQKIAAWMNLPSECTLEERFHHHLLHANMTLKEHNFLLSHSTHDKEEGAAWLSMHTYLDGLRSCHNVGSIVRTIEAFRLGPLHLSADMMKPDHPLIQKVSMGAWKDVSMDHGISLSSLPRPWIALETVASAPPWNQYSYNDPCTFILGNEERGISPSLLERCDAIVTIPLFGRKNSLNVSNAFSILAAEAATQVHRNVSGEKKIV
jgi:tRNA(Leu) C34 or U34 (ribose-2'-O)-methylase TrmL